MVTVTIQCNCFLSVVGANGNTVNLGPNFDPADSSAQTASCPAGLNWFSNPTSAAVTLPALYSCMSWVLPKEQVQEAMTASSTRGSVVITMHFAVSCYSDCGVVVGTPTATQVHSSGPAADVRCDLSPFSGVVYRPPTDCITPEGTTALQLPPSQPPADKVPPPPALSRPPPRPVRPPPMPVVLSAESDNCSSTPGGNPEHCSTCSGAEFLKSTCEAGDVKVGGSSGPLLLLHLEPSLHRAASIHARAIEPEAQHARQIPTVVVRPTALCVCSYLRTDIALLLCPHLQTQLRDLTDTSSPHVCLLPGSSCNPASICSGSMVTYSLAPRTGSFDKPGVKDGTITIFTQPDGASDGVWW